MGKVVLAAKVTHVPSMFISEMPGKHHGCRKPAIDGLKQIGDRIKAAGATTVVVFDTHWLVNSGYHINSNPHHKGVYTSPEFPHFIQDLAYDCAGNAELGDAIAQIATQNGVLTRSHNNVGSLGLDYGTLVPVRYMQLEDIKVLAIAGWMYDATFAESKIVGEAVRQAIEESGENVAVVASGSFSHSIWPNRDVEQGTFAISRQFNAWVDQHVIEMWQRGEFKQFIDIMDDYADHCDGEGNMHDTAMLLGVLGWDKYDGKAELITPYFPSSGTGQANLVLPVQ